MGPWAGVNGAFSTQKYTFKKYSGILKNKRVWKMSQKGAMWRMQKVDRAPHMIVHTHSGERAEKQLPEKPWFARGVSHMLFPDQPASRSGFLGMRKNSGGRWVGTNKVPAFGPYVKPKL